MKKYKAYFVVAVVQFVIAILVPNIACSVFNFTGKPLIAICIGSALLLGSAVLHCSIVRGRILDFAIVTDIVAKAETVVLAICIASLLFWLLFALSGSVNYTVAERSFLTAFIIVVLLIESTAIACVLSGIGLIHVGELFVSDKE